MAFKESILALGFPLVILGGIYSGIVTPTEAAAVSVVYALIVEGLIYRTLTFKKFKEMRISTSVTMGALMVLTASGQVFSFMLTFAKVPQNLANSIISFGSGQATTWIVVTLAFFVACMFMDCFPVILILTPIFFPIAKTVGINEIQLGVVITLLSALGCVTPPFGCNIFTAMTIFNENFYNVVKGLLPYILLALILCLFLILFPGISLWLPSMAAAH